MSYLRTIKAILQSPETLTLIMNDEDAKKVLAAWKRYRPAFTETAPRKGETDQSTLARWWSEIAPDTDRIARIAGVPATRARRIFERLIESNFVWPDGSIDSDAMNMLIGERNAYIRSLISIPVKKKDEGKPKEDKGKTDDGKRPEPQNQKANRKPRSS